MLRFFFFFFVFFRKLLFVDLDAHIRQQWKIRLWWPHAKDKILILTNLVWEEVKGAWTHKIFLGGEDVTVEGRDPVPDC